MYRKKKKGRPRKPTNGKCNGFVNGHCCYECPNANLEYACDKWDLDPSDFGVDYIDCEDCKYSDDICTCEDCYMNGNKDYCEKERGGRK